MSESQPQWTATRCWRCNHLLFRFRPLDVPAPAAIEVERKCERCKALNLTQV